MVEKIRQAMRGPGVPAEGQYLFDLFFELHVGRSMGGMGASALTWQDIDAWQRCMGYCLEPWEIRALRAMDGAFLAHVQLTTAGTEEERQRLQGTTLKLYAWDPAQDDEHDEDDGVEEADFELLDGTTDGPDYEVVA